jgi:hypothetical protein
VARDDLYTFETWDLVKVHLAYHKAFQANQNLDPLIVQAYAEIANELYSRGYGFVNDTWVDQLELAYLIPSREGKS